MVPLVERLSRRGADSGGASERPWTVRRHISYNHHVDPEVGAMTKERARDVDEYIAHAPASAQPALRQLRKAIADAVPEAEERLSYGMPYYHHHGRLAYFSLHTRHIGMYPFNAGDVDHELQRYAAEKATLQFPLGAPLPLAAIRRTVERRARELESKARARSARP
jgi:uncharacterized protein YdhG (YjbR/CyaY superfamily)